MKSRSHGADAKRPTGAASDVLRQIVVITALVGMLLGVWLGLGGLNGTPIDQAQGGALAAGASFLTPASTAFSIWSLIYLGLIAYAVWQALPSQRSTPRQRSTGWWIALVMALNGLWLVVVQYAPIWWSVIVIALLLATLVVTFQRTVATRRRDGAVIDSVLIDGVTGLHLGWVVVAFAANVAAWLTAVGATPWAAHPTTWGAGALIVILIAGIVIGWASDWRVTPGLAICWGLFWLGIARLIQQPRDEVLGWIAVTVGTIVGVVPLLVVGLRRQPPVGDAASSTSG